MVILFLSITQVVVANRLSTTGVALALLQDEMKFYMIENTKLSQKLFLALSFTSISSHAAQVGFVEGKSEFFSRTPPPIALKQ